MRPFVAGVLIETLIELKRGILVINVVMMQVSLTVCFCHRSAAEEKS